jgi:hypothetical protein
MKNEYLWNICGIEASLFSISDEKSVAVVLQIYILVRWYNPYVLHSQMRLGFKL